MSSFNSSAANFDLFLQTLMGRLQVRPSPPPATSSLHNPAFLNPQSLEDLLLNNLLADSESDNDDEYASSSKSQLAKEESRLEKDIIRSILSGKADDLKPNSGQAVTIGEHHICVGFHDDTDSNYRVWEWHGHIMLFDEENGYTPEYIYGNYFERVNKKFIKEDKKQEKYLKDGVDRDDSNEDDETAKEKEEKVVNLGLRELIDSTEPSNGRILHRNINASSPRF